jgi:hypothetical protein
MSRLILKNRNPIIQNSSDLQSTDFSLTDDFGNWSDPTQISWIWLPQSITVTKSDILSTYNLSLLEERILIYSSLYEKFLLVKRDNSHLPEANVGMDNSWSRLKVIYIDTSMNELIEGIYTINSATNSRTLWNGTVDPNENVIGNIGDFYINTATSILFGPKLTTTSMVWPTIGINMVGTMGNTILTGTDTSPSNSLGKDGDLYYNSSTRYLYGPKVGDVWPAGIPLNGTNGTNGNTILSGTVTPTVGVGNNGDIYINTAAGLFYGPKTGGIWPSGIPIIGQIGLEGKSVRSGSGPPNDVVLGNVGDFYIDTASANYVIYGPKVSVFYDTIWPTSETNLIGPAGKTILNGTVAPNGNVTAAVGDFYLNTATMTLYGPKVSTTATVWPTSGTVLNGKTLHNGTISPTAGIGVDGDFYFNTATSMIYGPKVSGNWPTGVSLIGAQGIPGNTLRNGTIAPTAGVGNDGDFYLNTATSTMYGPKAVGAWPSGFSIQGIQGNPGNTVLNGTIAPTTGIGNNGDFYINTTTNALYGPKTSGSWSTGVSLIGPAAVTTDRSRTFSYTSGTPAVGQFSMTSAVVGSYTVYTVLVSTTDSRGNNVLNYLLSLNGKEMSFTRDDETQQIVYSIINVVNNTTYVTFSCYPARKFTSTFALPPVTTIVNAGYGTQTFTTSTKWIVSRFTYSRFYEFSFYDAVVTTDMSTSRWAPMVKPLAAGSSSTKITVLSNTPEIWTAEYITMGLPGDRFTDTVNTVYRGNTDFYTWYTSYSIKGIPVLLHTECIVQARIWEEAPTGYNSGVPTYVNSTNTAISNIGNGISNTRSIKLVQNYPLVVTFGGVALFKRDHRYTFRFLTDNGNISIIIDEGTIEIISLFNGS